MGFGCYISCTQGNSTSISLNSLLQIELCRIRQSSAFSRFWRRTPAASSRAAGGPALAAPSARDDDAAPTARNGAGHAAHPTTGARHSAVRGGRGGVWESFEERRRRCGAFYDHGRLVLGRRGHRAPQGPDQHRHRCARHSRRSMDDDARHRRLTSPHTAAAPAPPHTHTPPPPPAGASSNYGAMHCGVRMHATFSPFGGPAPLTPAAAPLRLPPRPGGVPPIKASPPASARTSAAASSRWRSTPRARRRPASARE